MLDRTIKYFNMKTINFGSNNIFMHDQTGSWAKQTCRVYRAQSRFGKALASSATSYHDFWHSVRGTFWFFQTIFNLKFDHRQKNINSNLHTLWTYK